MATEVLPYDFSSVRPWVLNDLIFSAWMLWDTNFVDKHFEVAGKLLRLRKKRSVDVSSDDKSGEKIFIFSTCVLSSGWTRFCRSWDRIFPSIWSLVTKIVIFRGRLIFDTSFGLHFAILLGTYRHCRFVLVLKIEVSVCLPLGGK